MSFEKNHPPFTPEDYRPGSSDYPLSDRQRVPEAQSHTLSPEDQAALKELLNHWEKAKKTNDTKKINETTNEISVLIGRHVDDADLAALKKAISEGEFWEMSGREEIPAEEIKPTKETGETEEVVSETVGRERTRYGATLPLEISPERHRVLEVKGPSTKTLTRGRRGRALRKAAGKRAADDKGRKPREQREAA